MGYYIIMTCDGDFATPGAELKACGSYVLNAVKTTKVHGALTEVEVNVVYASS